MTSLHDTTIQQYLELCSAVYGQATKPEHSPEDRTRTTKLYHDLRHATIFEVEPTMWMRLHHLADKHVTEHLAGCRWRGPMDSPPTHEEVEAVIQHTMEDRNILPYPENWPGEYCYFSCGGVGMNVESFLATLQSFSSAANDSLKRTMLRSSEGVRVIAIGILASRHGDVHSIYQLGWAKLQPVDGSYVWMHEKRINAPWIESASLTPWILEMLTDAIAAFGTTILEQQQSTFDSRFKFQRAARKQKLKLNLPPPYYRVELKDELILEARRALRPSQPREWSHRWKVIEHDVIRVRRGLLPLDPDAEADLRDRRYKVFKEGHPDAACSELLLRRHVHPKRVDEWLAVLHTRRREHIKGPKDKPYIESVRHVPDSARA